VTAPACFDGMLTISPKFSFVQAACKSTFALELRAPESALISCKRYLVDAAKGGLEIPLRVTTPSQKTALHLTVRAQLTTSALRIEPAQVDFGRCNVGETTAVAVTLHNPSALPAPFGFLDLPRCMSFEQGGGFGTVPAGATLEQQLCFTPELAGQQSFQVTCKTLALRTFSVPCTATAEELPLAFSHNEIKMAATQVGSRASVSTLLRNNSSVEQAFEFGHLQGSGLTVAPQCATLAARASTRVQIDFRPTQPELGAAQMPGEPASASGGSGAHAGGNVPAAGSPAELAHSGQVGSRWPDSHTWSVPCYMRSSTGASGQITLNVATCAILPRVALQGLPFDSGKGRYVHAFGPLSIGGARLLSVMVANLTDGDLAVTMDSLMPSGAFEQVTAARPVPARGTRAVKLQFRPTRDGDHWEVVTLRAAGQALELQLSGSGVAPQLVLAPEGALASLELGDVRAGDEAAQTFTVSNSCPFALRYECRFRQLSCKNVGTQPAFFTKPGSATVPPGETATVTVVFQPDCQARDRPAMHQYKLFSSFCATQHLYACCTRGWLTYCLCAHAGHTNAMSNSVQGPCFEGWLDVKVPDQQHDLSLHVRGYGWSQGLYIRGASYKQPPPDALRSVAVLQQGTEADVHHLEATCAEPVCLGETKTHTLEVPCYADVCARSDQIELHVPTAGSRFCCSRAASTHDMVAHHRDKHHVQCRCAASSLHKAAHLWSLRWTPCRMRRRSRAGKSMPQRWWQALGSASRSRSA
jgi:hypothetical protein